MTRLNKAAVPFVLLCVLFDILGVGLIIPVLPQLVGDIAGSKSSQAWWLGAMLTAYGLMQFCFAPLLGALSDRYGRRPILLLGISGLAIMFFVPALSDSLPVILASRVLGGIFAGNVAVAQAYIADVTPPEKRSAAFGKLGACFGIGFILGPALGGLLGESDVRLPFFIAGVLSFLNFLYGAFILPESLKKRNLNPITFARCNPLSSLRRVSSFKNIGSLLVVIALSSFAQSVLHSTWSLFSSFRFHWTPMDIGLSLVVIGAVNVVVQGFLMRPLLKRMGPQRLILAGLCSGALAYLCFGLITVGSLAYLIFLFNFLSFAVSPTLNGIISDTVPADSQGDVLGTVSSLTSLMGVLAPLIGTPLLAHTSVQTSGSSLGGLPYFLCSLVMCAAIFFAIRFFKIHTQNKT